ncbi:MAG TPA: hypothetical protein VHK66_07225 [Microvirga sp.]|jgi:hypothetical protein|nr:hypothetical protein [Microvirga sp.]
MALWGDLNAILNRLVAAGTISRFWTNLGKQSPLLAPHVVVWPPGFVDDAGAEAIRKTVAENLSPLGEDVTVTVNREESSGPEAPSPDR